MLNKRRIRIYISGAYTGNIDANISIASEMAAKVWKAGYNAICPHTNTAHFERYTDVSYDDYLEGYLAILEVCDGVLLLKNWLSSSGARTEKKHAEELGIPVFYTVAEMDRYFESLTVLDRAKILVDGPRGKDYGHPSEDFACAAAMYSAWLNRKYHLGINLQAEDWPPAMICTKLSRLANRFKLDSLVDGPGYFRTWEMIEEVKKSK